MNSNTIIMIISAVVFIVFILWLIAASNKATKNMENTK